MELNTRGKENVRQAVHGLIRQLVSGAVGGLLAVLLFFWAEPRIFPPLPKQVPVSAPAEQPPKLWI